MARFFDQSDFDPQILKSETIAVIGYGNQGHAHALNLRDSGYQVIVGARPEGHAFAKAQAEGFNTLPIPEAAQSATTLMVTLPDEIIPDLWPQILPALAPGKCLLFAHGFNVVYNLIDLPANIDVGLVGPKGAGVKLRSEYLAGRGLAAIVAVHQNPTGHAWNRVLAYADGLGAFRTLVMETTFREETHCDLFGEQAVLCGGIPELLKAGYETLVAAGYSPEAAYFECIHEAKLITDLIYDRGLAQMRQAISNTAEWGGFQVGPSVIGPEARRAMDQTIQNIQSGDFAQNWIAEARSGMKTLKSLEAQEAVHPAEPVGQILRQKMKVVS